MMEIQQHDGVVVEVAGIPAGLRQAPRERRRRERGRAAPRERKSHVSGSPKTPTIYRGGGGAAPPSRVPPPKGCGQP